MGKTAERAKKLADWYWLHRDDILAKQKERRLTPEYKRHVREYYQQNKQRINERQKERRIERKLEKLGKQKANEFSRWHYNILDKREKACFVCGGVQNLVAHHVDYGIPDLTVTLCSPCHRKTHAGKIELKISTKECPLCKNISYTVTF